MVITFWWVHSNAEEQKLGFNEKEVIPAEDLSLYMFGLYYKDKSPFISKKYAEHLEKMKSVVHKNNWC